MEVFDIWKSNDQKVLFWTKLSMQMFLEKAPHVSGAVAYLFKSQWVEIWVSHTSACSDRLHSFTCSWPESLSTTWSPESITPVPGSQCKARSLCELAVCCHTGRCSMWAGMWLADVVLCTKSVHQRYSGTTQHNVFFVLFLFNVVVVISSPYWRACQKKKVQTRRHRFYQYPPGPRRNAPRWTRPPGSRTPDDFPPFSLLEHGICKADCSLHTHTHARKKRWKIVSGSWGTGWWSTDATPDGMWG